MTNEERRARLMEWVATVRELADFLENMPDCPDSQPTPEPTPEIVRDIEPVSGTQPARVTFMQDRFYPYWAVTGLHQIGPSPVLSVRVQDMQRNPLDGVHIRVEVEDADPEIVYEQDSGSKAPGQSEFVINRNKFTLWISQGASTDRVDGITTDINIDKGDMVNGHVETEVTFTKVVR